MLGVKRWTHSLPGSVPSNALAAHPLMRWCAMAYGPGTVSAPSADELDAGVFMGS